MLLRETIIPLLFAPVGSVIVQALFAGVLQQVDVFTHSFLIALGLVWGVSLGAGCVFVLPVFTLFPAARRPPTWVASLWGATISWPVARLLTGGLELSVIGSIGAALAGAASGFVYVIAARVAYRRNHPITRT